MIATAKRPRKIAKRSKTMKGSVRTADAAPTPAGNVGPMTLTRVTESEKALILRIRGLVTAGIIARNAVDVLSQRLIDQHSPKSRQWLDDLGISPPQ